MILTRIILICFCSILITCSGGSSSSTGGSTTPTNSAHYSVTPSLTHASSQPAGAQTISLGSSASITVTADNGYILSTSVGGTCPAGIWSGSIYSTGSVTADCTITFSAAAIPLWTGTAGNLNGGAWQDPAVLPDVGHAGAYGGANYAPNGDLYLFYSTGVYPNESLKNVIRRNGTNNWTAEYDAGFRNRSANVFFLAGQPYLATESGGSASIYTTDPNAIAWNSSAYFQCNDGNVDGYGSYGQAFLTHDGTNFHLFDTYLYANVVVGGENWGIQHVTQSNAVWPANGSSGTAIDPQGRPGYSAFPHGVSGAYQDNSNHILAFSNIALRSSDNGANFLQLMNNSGSAATDLTGVIASTQNPTDGSIIVANVYNSGGWKLALWGTRDFGVTFTNFKTYALGATPYRVALSSIKNLLVVAVTLDGGSGETMLSFDQSYDGGGTWAGMTNLANATAGGHPTYSFGSLFMTANSTSGAVALGYTLLDGNTHHGTYMKEFY